MNILCPDCEERVEDYEPGVSSVTLNGQLWHPACGRKEWMVLANDLLLREGCTANYVAEAREAFDEGDTPQGFVDGLLHLWEQNSDPFPQREFPTAEND